MTGYSIGDMIDKQQELKAFIEAEEASLAEWLKPYKEARAAIEVACGVELQRQKLQNFKGENGTAYLKHSDGIKVDNQQTFLQFVRSQERWDMLSVGLLVDPVREFQAKDPNGALPPGVTSNPSVTCIIRK
jgi:hypothetical protein